MVLTYLLLTLTSQPARVSAEEMNVLERFIVLLYDKRSVNISVNAVRLRHFSLHPGSLENIPLQLLLCCSTSTVHSIRQVERF